MKKIPFNIDIVLQGIEEQVKQRIQDYKSETDDLSDFLPPDPYIPRYTHNDIPETSSISYTEPAIYENSSDKFSNQWLLEQCHHHSQLTKSEFPPSQLSTDIYDLLNSKRNGIQEFILIT